MEQEYSNFIRTARQQKLTEEEKVFHCQHTILSYAVSRLHYYAVLAMKTFENLSLPKKLMVEILNKNMREEEAISAFHFSKQKELENESFLDNANYEKQKEAMISLMKDFHERMQNNLRQKIEIYFPRLSVVGLINEQEEVMKFFLISDDMHRHCGIDDFSEYFYDTEKIAEIKNKLTKRKEDISFIGFDDLLSSIDKKYNIKNERISFYNDIKECQSFANFIKHKSWKSYNNLLKYPNLLFLLKTMTEDHREPVLSLSDFYRYIRSFENFWIHICKNVHEPMEHNDFIVESHKQINLHIKQYQEHPWNKEGKIMEKIEKGW